MFLHRLINLGMVEIHDDVYCDCRLGAEHGYTDPVTRAEIPWSWVELRPMYSELCCVRLLRINTIDTLGLNLTLAYLLVRCVFTYTQRIYSEYMTTCRENPPMETSVLPGFNLEPFACMRTTQGSTRFGPSLPSPVRTVQS